MSARPEFRRRKSKELRYRGWIHRRRWEFQHRRGDLREAAFRYRGAAAFAKLAGDPADQLRNAVDAAFHLDLLAQLDNDEKYAALAENSSIDLY